MKKLKKSLSLLLALVMVLSCMSMSAMAADTTIVGPTYDFAKNRVQFVMSGFDDTAMYDLRITFNKDVSGSLDFFIDPTWKTPITGSNFTANTQYMLLEYIAKNNNTAVYNDMLHLSGSGISGAVINNTFNGSFPCGVTYTNAPAGTTMTVEVMKNSSSVVTATCVLNPVAKIGDTGYATLQAAVAAATEGATITLLKDIELASEVIVTTTGENVHQTSNFNTDQIASKKLSSLTIDGNNHTISMASEHAYGGKYTLSGQSAFFFGAYSDDANSSITDNAYTLKNITFTGFDCMIIHAKRCTVNLEDCMFQDNHVTVGLGSGSSTDMIETLNAALRIDGCTFTGNTTSGKYALIYTNNQVPDSTVTISNNLFEDNGTSTNPVGGNGLALLSNVASSNDAVTNNTFISNYITMTDGNAAVIYASQPVETITGNLFTSNHVTAPSDKKAGVIVLGSGTTGSSVTGNAFVDNTLAGATTKIATMVVGSASNISNNYWNDGGEPETGTSKDIYLDGNPTITNTGYATSFTPGTTGATVSNDQPVVEYSYIGANGYLADYFVLNFYVTSGDATTDDFTVTRSDNATISPVTSKSAFCTRNASVYYVEKVTGATNSLGLKNLGGAGCWMISVKCFTRNLDKTLTLSVNGATVQSLSFLDYLQGMANSSDSKASAYQSLYNGLSSAVPGAQALDN